MTYRSVKSDLQIRKETYERDLLTFTETSVWSMVTAFRREILEATKRSVKSDLQIRKETFERDLLTFTDSPVYGTGVW